MRVFELTASHRGTAAAVAARVLPDGAEAPLDVWYRLEGCGAPPGGLGDAFAVAMLLPAMFESRALSIDAPISGQLLENLGKAQEILSSWYDYLTPVAISSPRLAGGQEQSERAEGVGCCFTGGVDSWYSLLKNERRITHLVLVRGFDVGLDNDALWDQTRSRVARVADRLGKRLITCSTNLRAVADKRRAAWGRRHDGDFWGECLHGAALASVPLLLPNEIGELIVPATHTYRQVKPWGSSPLLDHLWSNHVIRITHDGCEADRVEKTRALARSDLALETLRVCHDDTASYNCGRCEKCLRTMAALRTCGALERAGTFPDGLSLSRVRQLIVPPHLRHRYDELIDAGSRSGDDALVRAVRSALGQRVSLVHAKARLKAAIRGSFVGEPLRAAHRRIHRLRSEHRVVEP